MLRFIPLLVFCLVRLHAYDQPPKEPVHFRGEAEKERIRILELLEDCPDLKAIEARFGSDDWKRVAPLYIPGTGYTTKAGPSCVPSTTAYFYCHRFGAVSERVDLDIITVNDGVIAAILITEK